MPKGIKDTCLISWVISKYEINCHLFKWRAIVVLDLIFTFKPMGR